MKYILALLITSIISISAECQSRRNLFMKNNILLKQLSTKSDNYETVLGKDFDVKLDSVVYLTGISTNSSESHPWLSDDGLRIYYTSDKNLGLKIYYASRENIHKNFSNPSPLNINSKTVDNYSCWLSNDELDIYITIEEPNFGLLSTLYHAHRNIITENFGTPTIITLSGNYNGYISNPSFSADLNTLYLFNDFLTKNDVYIYNVYIFQKTFDNTYILTDSINPPIGYEIGPGQLSDDGLRYYLSLNTNRNEYLYYYKRENLNEKFNEFYLLKNSLLTIGDNFWPSVSSTGNLFAFARTRNGWDELDLFMAYSSSNIFSSNKTLAYDPSIRIYPNPSSNFLTIYFDDFSKDEIEKIEVYSSAGILIYTEHIKSGDNQIILSVENYKSGLYFYSFKSNYGLVAGGKFMVKNQ